MLPRNHPDRIQIAFDDHRLVANAGLLLPVTLAQHLGLRELVDHHLDLGGARLTLARHNGPSHIHGDIKFRPHIHRATAKAIAAGKKPESEAAETNRFTTLNEAFRCLLDDFRVEGISPPELDQPRLM